MAIKYKNNYGKVSISETVIANIAAASILAKVSRDRVMLEIDKLYPEYQFAKHKGYGTKLHRELLQKYGMCPVHRRSFMKKILGEIHG